MYLLAIDFRQEFAARNRATLRRRVRRLGSRRIRQPEPAPMELFPFEPAGPVPPMERVEEECERWDGLS